MNCLRIDQIYLYLEKELLETEISAINEHLHSCSLCQNAVEERRVLLEASDCLPAIEPPPQFTSEIMARIFPERISLRASLLAAATAFTSALASLLILFLLSGQSVANMLVGLNQSTVSLARNILVGGAKLIKVIVLFFKLIYQFSEFLVKGLGRLTGILSPEFQIILITLTLISTTLLYFRVKRKLLTGDKI